MCTVSERGTVSVGRPSKTALPGTLTSWGSCWRPLAPDPGGPPCFWAVTRGVPGQAPKLCTSWPHTRRISPVRRTGEAEAARETG